MKKKKNKFDLDRVINILLYFILLIFSIFWEFFSGVIPNLEIHILLTILIGILLSSEIFITLSLEKIQKKISTFENNELIEMEDLNPALMNALKGRKKIKKLRIYALSTTVIQPIIRSSLDCKIDECIILMRSLNDNTYNKLFSGTVKSLITMWDELKDDGRIGSVEKYYYDDLPSEYNIIIDDELLIIGNYVFTNSDRANVTINKVFTINNHRSMGQEVINRYIYRFDTSIEYFKKINGNSIRR